jgi:large subunit ribosomal protein L17
MFRNMVTSLLKHDRIQTTDTKAKELRRWVDHVITLAKRGDLHARRQALAIVRDKSVVHKLFDSAQELFGNRAGGYSRLVKLGRRAGDAAPMTLVELIIPEEKAADKKKKEKAAKKETPAAAASASGNDAAPEKPAEQTESAAPAETGEGVKETYT